MVSTLVTVVGQPNNPMLAGKGGFKRGLPTYIHTFIFLHTYIHTFISADKNIETYIHTLTAHIFKYKEKFAQKNSFIHTYIHTYIHTHILRSCIHTYTYIQIIHHHSKGKVRLPWRPSRLSISAVSSPQMYAPAPRWR